MKKVKVWDPLVRLFHWSLVILFCANAFAIDTEGDLHQVVGYGVAALVGLRIIWGFIGTKHARFEDFPPSIVGSLDQVKDMATGRRHAHVGHSPLGALMIYNLLLALVVIAATGYMMTTNTWFGIRWVKDMHEIFVTWAEISILFHVLAVIYESRRLKINLAKSMLTGTKTIPDELQRK